MAKPYFCLLLHALAILQTFSPSRSQPYIGVNYGVVADNLPPATSTAQLLLNTTISKLRLYGVDPPIIRALAGTNISIVVGTANSDIPSLASDPSAAAAWAAANIVPYLPTITAVSVGNEVLNSGDPNLYSQLLPAMQNLRAALAAASPSPIVVTTVHSMAILSQSDPPSSGAFHSDLAQDLAGIVGFLHQYGFPFMINPYPYFAYQSDPRPETLAFCLFQPNAGRVDAGSGVTYMNMFDAQVDAVRSALRAAGFAAGVEVVVAETGWPHAGNTGEVGPGVDNAAAYVGGLVNHLRSMSGTPPPETYIFELYDEDGKPGPTSERSFGLYRPADLSMNYDAGLQRSAASGSDSLAPPPPTSPPPPPPPPPLMEQPAQEASSSGAGLLTPAESCVQSISSNLCSPQGQGGGAGAGAGVTTSSFSDGHVGREGSRSAAFGGCLVLFLTSWLML